MLKGISIKKLHNRYDYNIVFNKDLTLLYGSNGCGKTTILNIISIIITGKFYQLYKYQFESIVLELYGDEQLIQIYFDTKSEKIYVDFNNRIFEIKRRINFEFYNEFEYKIKGISKDEIDLENKMNSIFNFIYLPLNRSLVYHDYYKNLKYSDNNSFNNYLDCALNEVEDIISEATRKITLKENAINKDYQKDILSSSINHFKEEDIPTLIFGAKSIDLKQVEDNRKKYINILKDLKMYDLDMKIKIDDFFDSFGRYIRTFRSKKSFTNFNIVMLWTYIEYLKIEDVIEMAEKYNEIKSNIRKPITDFQSIINDFLKYGAINKKIRLKQDGDVYIETDNNPLDLYELSSGEKQLIITFAKLIFSIKQNRKNIFIVDEPESSLHLSWQSLLIPKLLSVDKNVQFIFATHSPEIVGEYRSYTKNVKPLDRK